MPKGKLNILLLALLVAAMVMVPMVSAADRPMPIVDWSNVAPTQPFTEQDLITFVVAEKTLDEITENQEKSPTFSLDENVFSLNDAPMDSPSILSRYNIAKGVKTDESVAVVSIPKTMYVYLEQNAGEKPVKIPREMFRTYSSLNDFLTHQAAFSESDHVDISKKYTNVTPTIIYPNMVTSAATGYRYQKWDEFTTDDMGIQPVMVTGKIAPSTYQTSPTGVYIYEEEEIHLNRLDSDGDGIDVIEIVAAYDVGSSGGPNGGTSGINLFPVFYNGDVNQNPIFTGYIHVPSAPHSYNFYVGIGSGTTQGKYDVWFEDTNTGQWLASYSYQDNNNPSSYIRSPRVSSEQTILPGASGSFNAYTSPIVVEHVLEGSTWSRPMEAFRYWRPVQNVPSLRFVSTSYDFQWWNGYLVQSSSCSGTI